MSLTTESPKIKVFLFFSLFILFTFLLSLVRILFEGLTLTLFLQTPEDEDLLMLGTSISGLFMTLISLSLSDSADSFGVDFNESCFSCIIF